MIALHLNAGNSTNGNPRRCFLILDNATAVACVDEGYMGRRAIERAGFPGALHDEWTPAIKITPGEYRRLLRELPNDRAALDAQRQEA